MKDNIIQIAKYLEKTHNKKVDAQDLALIELALKQEEYNEKNNMDF